MKKIGVYGYEITMGNGTVILTVPKEALRKEVLVNRRCNDIIAISGVASIASAATAVIAAKKGNIEVAETAIKVGDTATSIGLLALCGKCVALDKIVSNMGLKEAFTEKK